MHAERYDVPDATLDAVGTRRARRGRRHDVAAVPRGGRGERASAAARPNCSSTATTRSRSSTVLLTNFHLPGSSLLALLDAFAGAALARPVRRRARARATGSCPSATPCSWIDARDEHRHADHGRRDRRRRARRHGDHRPRHASRRRASCPSARAARCKAIDAADLEAVGAEVVLGNTYHLMLRPGADVVADTGRARRVHAAGGATRSPTPAGSRCSRSTRRSTTTA